MKKNSDDSNTTTDTEADKNTTESDKESETGKSDSDSEVAKQWMAGLPIEIRRALEKQHNEAKYPSKRHRQLVSPPSRNDAKPSILDAEPSIVLDSDPAQYRRQAVKVKTQIDKRIADLCQTEMDTRLAEIVCSCLYTRSANPAPDQTQVDYVVELIYDQWSYLGYPLPLTTQQAKAELVRMLKIIRKAFHQVRDSVTDKELAAFLRYYDPNPGLLKARPRLNNGNNN